MASINDLYGVIDDAVGLAEQIETEWDSDDEDLELIAKLARKLQLCAETIVDVASTSDQALSRYPIREAQIEECWSNRVCAAPAA